MSDLELITPPSPAASPMRMYAVVMSVGVTCAIAIVAVYETTRPMIARSKRDALQRAVLDVLPGAVRTEQFRLRPDGRFEQHRDSDERQATVHAAYDQQGRLVGLAIEAEGMGYQDMIRVLYGYSFQDRAIIGMRVLESRETPGLGDRAETDAAFQQNFRRLSVRLAPDGSEPAHPLEFVKAGQKRFPWQIDGISGATITTRAIASMLRQSTTRWIPIAERRRSDFDLPSPRAGSGSTEHGD